MNPLLRQEHLDIKVQCPTKDHATSKWQSQHLTSSLPFSQPLLLCCLLFLHQHFLPFCKSPDDNRCGEECGLCEQGLVFFSFPCSVHCVSICSINFCWAFIMCQVLY